MTNVVTLTNGKRVANFSSPHSFTYEDGTILPAVSDSEAERLKVTFHEMVADNGDVELTFSLDRDVVEEMLLWIQKVKNNEVDVVIVPLPMLTAMKRSFSMEKIKEMPFRSIRIEDRINKLVSIHKQCI